MSKVCEYHLEEGIEYIKVHGLQRTGTNYLAHLINENFQNVRALINVGGWKHGHYCAPWVLGREVHVLTVTKNPYAWLVSLYNYWKSSDVGEDLTNVPFDVFVKHRAVFERAKGSPSLMRASNPVQHWNNMNFHWLSIKTNTKKVLAVPYEALLFATDDVLNAISNDMGLKRAEAFTEPAKKLLPGTEEPKFADEEWQGRDYYFKEQFLDSYTPELLGFVNKNLDPEVMGTLGYSFVKEDR